MSDFFEKRRIAEEAEKAAAAARLSESKERSRDSRIQRDLRKVESGGRVSSFLKREAESDEVLKASIGLASARDPVSLAQATIQYQKATGTQSGPAPKIEHIFKENFDARLPNGTNNGDLLFWDSSSEKWTILAPPSGSGLKVLASNGGVPFWNDTEDCD